MTSPFLGAADEARVFALCTLEFGPIIIGFLVLFFDMHFNFFWKLFFSRAGGGFVV